VVESFEIAGRGWVATGTMDADEAPSLGAVDVTVPGEEAFQSEAIAFERFAIQQWWRLSCGVILRPAQKLPPGTIIRRNA
jgi:hypothetical protein